MTLPVEKILYVAGPITGVKNYRPVFDKLASKLTNRGYTVINPACLPVGLKCHEDYMTICIPMVTVSEAVVLLPSWRKSVGAVREYAHAKSLGKPCYQVVSFSPLKFELV